MLRIGFIGTGMIAWAHALGIQAMIDAGQIDATVMAVYDADEQRAGGFAAANGATATDDAREVCQHCDAVWICTPTAGHPAALEMALAEGCAVFCEKPLARDLAEAEAMLAAAQASGLPAQVGLVLRSTPVFRSLRELVTSGQLGPPMAAFFRDDQYFPVQGVYGSTWRADVQIAGGGCLIEHSIHDLDILRFCLGEVDEVAGQIAGFSGHPGVEDVANASLRFTSGASAQLLSVWHRILTRGSTRRLELFCQDGMVWLDNDFLGPLHVQTSQGLETRPCPPPEWISALPLAHDDIGLVIRMYAEADRAFVEAASGHHEAQPSFGEAVVAHRLVDGVYRSAAAGGAPVAVG